MPLIRYLTKHVVKTAKKKKKKNEKEYKFKYCQNNNRLHSRHFLSVRCQRRSSGASAAATPRKMAQVVKYKQNTNPVWF